MTIVTVPNAASTFAAAACVPGTRDRWISLGFMPTVGGSGSVAYWAGSSVTDGSPLLPIVCAAGIGYQSPIFNQPLQNIMVASIAGGCAIVWVHAAS